MGTDQGKTSNINALAMLAALRNVDIPATGTTTFRPPFTPVAFGALAGRTSDIIFGRSAGHRFMTGTSPTAGR